MEEEGEAAGGGGRGRGRRKGRTGEEEGEDGRGGGNGTGRRINLPSEHLLVVKLPYDRIFPCVSWMVGWSVCHNFS